MWKYIRRQTGNELNLGQSLRRDPLLAHDEVKTVQWPQGLNQNTEAWFSGCNGLGINATLRKIYNWGFQSDDISLNQIHIIKKPSHRFRETERGFMQHFFNNCLHLHNVQWLTLMVRLLPGSSRTPCCSSTALCSGAIVMLYLSEIPNPEFSVMNSILESRTFLFSSSSFLSNILWRRKLFVAKQKLCRLSFLTDLSQRSLIQLSSVFCLMHKRPTFCQGHLCSLYW